MKKTYHIDGLESDIKAGTFEQTFEDMENISNVEIDVENSKVTIESENAIDIGHLNDALSETNITLSEE